jgi:hypothetical protein
VDQVEHRPRQLRHDRHAGHGCTAGERVERSRDAFIDPVARGAGGRSQQSQVFARLFAEDLQRIEGFGLEDEFRDRLRRRLRCLDYRPGRVIRSPGRDAFRARDDAGHRVHRAWHTGCEGVAQRRYDAAGFGDDPLGLPVRIDGAVDDPVEHLLDRPGQLAQHLRTHQPPAALQGMERAPQLHGMLAFTNVLLPGRQVLVDGPEHLVHLFQEHLEDLVIDLELVLERRQAPTSRVLFRILRRLRDSIQFLSGWGRGLGERGFDTHGFVNSSGWFRSSDLVGEIRRLERGGLGAGLGAGLDVELDVDAPFDDVSIGWLREDGRFRRCNELDVRRRTLEREHR